MYPSTNPTDSPAPVGRHKSAFVDNVQLMSMFRHHNHIPPSNNSLTAEPVDDIASVCTSCQAFNNHCSLQRHTCPTLELEVPHAPRQLCFRIHLSGGRPSQPFPRSLAPTQQRPGTRPRCVTQPLHSPFIGGLQRHTRSTLELEVLHAPQQRYFRIHLS